MARVLIAGEVDLAPERRDAALNGAGPHVAAALAEPGCRHYAWTASPDLPGRIHVFEEWDSEADLQAHLEGAPYRAMLAHLSGFGILNADTRKYRCDRVEPVYGPDGVATARFTDG